MAVLLPEPCASRRAEQSNLLVSKYACSEIALPCNTYILFYAKISSIMSKKNKGKDLKPNKPSRTSVEGSNKSKITLAPETRNGIYAIISFVIALFFVLSSFEKAGIAGKFFYEIFTYLFGIGYFLLPVVFVLLGMSYLRPVRPNIGSLHIISSLLFFLSALGIIDIFKSGQGGVFGVFASFPFVKLFDVYSSVIFLVAILAISLFLLFDLELKIAPVLKKFFTWLINLFRKHAEEISEEIEPEISKEVQPQVQVDEPQIEKESESKSRKKKSEDVEEDFSKITTHSSKAGSGGYVPPPLSLLEEDKGKPNVGDIKANSNIIKRTLQNFGIEVEMDEITIGPTVTRYALKPAEGVKLTKILSLQNDLALALAAFPIRIEAPIPGKSLVGIEIPNRSKSTVGLATLLSDEKFIKSIKPLTVALGKNIAGSATFSSLAKMPHAMIAGTTGSGKSVTIHAIVTSLLYKNSPEQMRLILIDPKRVELTLYNKIPHLLTPVITEPKKAILALKWAAKEMDRRYDILEKESVRDISSYHSSIGKTKDSAEPRENMPYIVIIIDELADIMSTYPRELESAIVRLAQMSRAVGIHLILSTQRPSVNVITGLIKANIPARIALQVSSQIDSRTILDTGGAEKLLGAGDMLFLSGEMAQPERLQSAFISEGEVKKVVKFLSDQFKDELPSDLNLTGSVSPDKTIFDSSFDSDGEDDDDMYEEARQTVIEAGKASTSYLQRKLKLGYARAARLMDILEERGVVGPGDGAKPREVLEKMDHGIDIQTNEGELLPPIN